MEKNLLKIYSEEDLVFKLNHILNDILCTRKDKILLKHPDSNKIAKFVNNWIKENK